MTRLRTSGSSALSRPYTGVTRHLGSSDTVVVAHDLGEDVQDLLLDLYTESDSNPGEGLAPARSTFVHVIPFHSAACFGEQNI